MSSSDANLDQDLRKLYGASAREHSSACVDEEILQRARAHARKTRLQARWRLAITAAAAMLLLLVGQAWQRQREQAAVESAAVRAHYAEVTQAYLLNARTGRSDPSAVARYLLDRHERDQPDDRPGYTAPVLAHPQGT